MLTGGEGNDKLIGDDSDDPILLSRARPGQNYAGLDVLAGGTGNDTVFGALGADVLFAGDGPERSERGADAADSFTLFELPAEGEDGEESDPVDLAESTAAAALQFLQGLINTATNVRSLGLINWWVASTATRSLATVSALLAKPSYWRRLSLRRDLEIDLNEDGNAGEKVEDLITTLEYLGDDDGFSLSKEAPVALC